MVGKPQHIYAWLFCGFAALGACIYGYDGVYFNGVSSLVSVSLTHNILFFTHKGQDIFVRHFGTRMADGQYKLSPSELSVMTSMINVGELVGSLSAAPLNDYFGRKVVFLLAATMLAIGVVLQLVTSSSRGLITGGRTIMGLGVGAFSSTSPLYIAVSVVIKDFFACTDRGILTGGRSDFDSWTSANVLAIDDFAVTNSGSSHYQGNRVQPNYSCVSSSNRITTLVPSPGLPLHLFCSRIPKMASQSRQKRQSKSCSTFDPSG